MAWTTQADAQTCEKLWQRYADRLLLYATAFLADRATAEDALQTVFAKLLTSASLPPPDELPAYLFTAIRNQGVSTLRSLKRAGRVSGHLLGLPPVDPADHADREETRLAIERALMGLPGEKREAVVLKVYGDLSIPDAASVVGVTQKTFEHRYYRGLAALKEILGGRHDGD